mmetsp:Transcript_2528/g.4452  ORF Transcript_2528/g.4452 Transcript_2528/m.4452 type:complete len:310 (-) Transcript_2528:836-1765(-)|eukprot:CAMPEP_0182441640 /NCGR_PEP_ID=MMETSP1172-20130603/623_1 /TAXON_ID=708627 /ORGANISM="Timspurckia oligopyrenoides, Strain CCMP3278" /LENGTH=309 /DNA_ID=CAMNT_0024636069 /DNA_START=172 /DNA_END=1101 /DNA_ORIENTATION=+
MDLSGIENGGGCGNLVESCSPRTGGSTAAYVGVPSSAQVGSGLGHDTLESRVMCATSKLNRNEDENVTSVKGSRSASKHSANARSQRAPVGMNRRLRRVMNEMYLKRSAGKLRGDAPGEEPDLFDPDELKQLFAVNFRSVFSDLVESREAVEKFSPFTSVTEEQQTALFEKLEKKKVSKKSSAIEKRSNESEKKSALCAKKRFELVERKVRSLILSKYETVIPILRSVEERIVEYRNVFGSSAVQTIEMTDSFHRLLAHGVAHFYCMRSSTVTLAQQDIRGVRFHPTESSIPELPPMSLADYASTLVKC